ncbi:MAG: hypothetical protein AD742_05855 [Methylibium sp. NZG]|nr:MAG: hypothetical protein AD742_05855 [Methylibium sp. NZG]
MLIGGCSTPFPEPVFDPPNATFPGLMQLAEEPGGPLDLFIVHGMCHHNDEWARGWLDLIAQALGSRADMRPSPPADPANEIKVFSADIALPGSHKVRAHAVVWSGLTKPLKDRLCYDQTNKSKSCLLKPKPKDTPYPHPRATLNALVKDRLLNDCFSDAVIYQGQARKAIVEQMQAVLAASRPATTLSTDTPKWALISSSLGSKLVFDSVFGLTVSTEGNKRQAGANLRDGLRHVVWLSNQVPLLRLGDESLTGSKPTAETAVEQFRKDGRLPVDSLDALMEQRRQFKRDDSPLKVASYTDPNDLLSYVVRSPVDPPQDKPRYEVIDIVSSNSSTLLGLLANPVSVHTGYSKNDEVMRSVICGQPKRRDCK